MTTTTKEAEMPQEASEKKRNEYMMQVEDGDGRQETIMAPYPIRGPEDAKRYCLKHSIKGDFTVWLKVAEFTVREKQVPVFEVV